MRSFVKGALIGSLTVLGLRKLTALPPRRAPLPETGKPLPSCGPYPNAVNTQATDAQHALEPLHFEGSAEDAQAYLRLILHQLDHCVVRLDLPGQLWVICRSPVLGFVDDMDFLIDDEQKLIHMRAQARMGRKDFDKNRERLEHIRRLWRENGFGS